MHHRAFHPGFSYAVLVATVDEAFMRFYALLNRKARLIARLTVALIPLMMLLVGSCKTSQLPGAYGSNAGPAQFRTALFPDQVNFKGMSYYPAEGYISRAQKYVAGAPESLALLTDREIGYLFGKPALERHDADARVMQFKAEDCVVDFFFYSEAKGDPSAVSFYDVRGNAEKDACLDRVITEGDFSAERI